MFAAPPKLLPLNIYWCVLFWIWPKPEAFWWSLCVLLSELRAGIPLFLSKVASVEFSILFWERLFEVFVTKPSECRSTCGAYVLSKGPLLYCPVLSWPANWVVGNKSAGSVDCMFELEARRDFLEAMWATIELRFELLTDWVWNWAWGKTVSWELSALRLF